MIPLVAHQITVAASQLFAREGGPGAALGVMQNGRLIYVKTFGVRSLSSKAPVDAQTRFEIGSVTKMFTAAAILQLKERGKLTLDQRLAAYVPGFPHAKDVTIRQLLTHTSGMPEYEDMPDVEAQMAQTADALPVIERYVSKPLTFKPGSRFSYSNTNYIALGLVIQAVSGVTYERYVREHLFAPASMTHSGFIDEEPTMNDVATPYSESEKSPGGLAPSPRIFESWAGGAGSIVSTIGDMASWDAALMDGKIISESDFALMSSPVALPGGKHESYGMGADIDVLDGHRRVGHDGATNGSSATNGLYPHDRTAIIVFENFRPAVPFTFEEIALDRLFPDAAAAIRRPAPGEDLSMRPRIIGLIDGVLNGTIASSDIAPTMQAFFTAERRKAIAAHFGRLGRMTGATFKGMRVDGKQTWYDYRVEFEHGASECAIAVNGEHLLTNLSVLPSA